MQLDPLQVCPCPPGEAFSDFVATWQSCNALQLTPQDKQRGASITTLFGVTRNPNTDCSAAIGSFFLEKMEATSATEAKIGRIGVISSFAALDCNKNFIWPDEKIVGFFDELLFPSDLANG